jgi:hypothetical protein
MGGRYVLEVSNSKYPQKPARLYHLLWLLKRKNASLPWREAGAI